MSEDQQRPEWLLDAEACPTTDPRHWLLKGYNTIHAEAHRLRRAGQHREAVEKTRAAKKFLRQIKHLTTQEKVWSRRLTGDEARNAVPQATREPQRAPLERKRSEEEEWSSFFASIKDDDSAELRRWEN